MSASPAASSDADLPRVVVVGPRGRGGVSVAVRRVVGALPDSVDLLAVGRRAGERTVVAALARDVPALAATARRAQVVHLHPSLRWRALFRDAHLHAIARRASCRTVVQFHGWDRALAERLHSDPWARRVLVAPLLRADALVVLADAFGDALVRWGADPACVHVVANPYDPAEVPAASGTARDTVLFLGRLTAAKGAGVTLEAFGRLAMPGLRLVLAGDGPSKADLERRVAGLGLGDRVSMPGWVDGEEKTALFARARLLALPSRGEAAPLAVIEALAAGVPVVATRTGAVPSLVGRAGVLVDVPTVDAVEGAFRSALADPTLGGTGPLQVAHCTPGRVAEQWRAIWASVLP